MVRKPSYLKALVICHGKSEKQMCQFIKSNLRIRIEIVSDKKGEKSIQINSIMKILNGKIFKSFSNFTHEFEDVEVCREKTKSNLSESFKIFISMDTDDCNEIQKKSFLNKEMFKKHWAYQYIHPIYNMPDLETVLSKSNIKFEKKGDDRKKEYIKIFPTDPKYKNKEILQIDDFCKSLKINNSTNMNEFVEFCIDLLN